MYSKVAPSWAVALTMNMLRSSIGASSSLRLRKKNAVAPKVQSRITMAAQR